MKRVGENVVRIEAAALRELADRIAGPMGGAFGRAVELMFDCRGRVVVTGMGKSGLIGRKIAARLRCSGTIKRARTREQLVPSLVRDGPITHVAQR